MCDNASGTAENEALAAALNTMLYEDEDYTFVKNRNFVYIAASEAFAAMAGVASAKEIIGKNDFEIFSKELAEKYRRDDIDVLEGKAISGVLERIPDKDGIHRWTKTWKKAVLDKNGNAIGLYAIGHDVSKIMNLESETRRAKEYVDLIRNIPGGVGILHENGGIFFLDYANEGFFNVHCMEREPETKYIGANALEMVYEPDRKTVNEEYARVKEDKNTQGRVLYRTPSQDGTLHWIDAQFSFAYEKDGLKYYYVSYTNLDKQKQAEKRLEEGRSELQEAINNSDIQYYTYFPSKHYLEIYILNSHYSKLPVKWENYPESFIRYMKMSNGDAKLFRKMVSDIDAGVDEAACVTRMYYDGNYLWIKAKMLAVKDETGHIIKVQGYATNVTAQKKAEERLQKEKVRIKTLEGSTFEAFSFNVTKNSQANLVTSDAGLMDIDVSETVRREADIYAPAIGDPQSETRNVMLHVANRIPDAEGRKLYLSSCGGNGVRKAINEGKFKSVIRYRRRIGNVVRWVSSSIEMLPEPESGDLIAFFYTSDINEQVINEKISERIISTNYVTVAYCDLQTKKMFVKSTTDKNGTDFNGLLYGEAIEMICKNDIMASESEQCMQKLELEKVKDELEANPVYTVYYTRNEYSEKLEGKPLRKFKTDIFYLDTHKDILVMLLTDVTAIFEQERENREKMAQALAAAEQASVAKTEFLSRMSHEIRTPMNAIIGLDAIALQEKDISTAMVDHLQKIGISARFLLSLINDILDMSRIESGRMMLKNEPFDFEEIINGINTILYEQCRNSSIDYDCVLKSYTEAGYVGDATKLQQVLLNILGNAVKFTPKGGKIHFMIEQTARNRERAKLRFEISDTGIGIDEKFLPHIFEPFSQENRGRTSSYGGTGLGLAISKNIVNLMGGDITVHSIKNIGSNFIVEVELGLREDDVRRRNIGEKPIKPLFTLIVDDDVIICRHTQMILNDAGLKAEWADCGADAVEKVAGMHKAHNDYDLVLLDWQMPDMDGIETARKIRTIVGPEVTIIIMTAYDWADIELKARAAGVDMFMKKPIFASSVTKAFENVFSKKKDETEPEESRDFDFSGKRVLLAEDNEINAEIAKHILESKNCTVELAQNGAEAVESFAQAQCGYYNAILMDVRMPVMDGLEATKAIRAMRKADSKSIPIIAMTANAFQEDVNLSLESGMNLHLAKPIEPMTLYKALERFLIG